MARVFSKVKSKVAHRTTAPKKVELESLRDDEAVKADEALAAATDHIPAIVQQRYDERVAPFLFQVTLMSRGGETLDSVAKFLGMSRQSLDSYRSRFPKLQEALDIGTMAAEDAAVFALEKLVTGYAYKETKETTGKSADGPPVVETWIKQKHPDINAIMFFLTNRCSGEWRKSVNGVQTANNVTLALGASNMSDASIAHLLAKQDDKLFKGLFFPSDPQDAEVAEDGRDEEYSGADTAPPQDGCVSTDGEPDDDMGDLDG